jgi:hypothetical protein
LNFFGLMINESTNIIIIEYLVILATFVEDGFHVSVFLGLLEISNGRKILKKFLKFYFWL